MASQFPPRCKVADRVPLMAALEKAHPNPKSELRFTTPFELLVAVVLSAQATDKSVNLATRQLYAHANTPETILALGERGLIPFISKIGLYRNKAKHVIGLCKRLVEVYGGVVPESREELMTLPGVGRKTANVVLNVAFGHPTIAVDTHIFRVSHRLGLSRGETPDAVEADLRRIIPKEFRQHAHHYLLLHGRYCCKARGPLCKECPVTQFCSSKDKKIA